MAETKPFASLSSGLLARKGAAKPAMRPQGFGSFGGSLEDLGWNDMGAGPASVHDIHEMHEHVPSSIEALTPAPGGRAPAEPPAIVEQQRELEARLQPESQPESFEAAADIADAEPDPDPRPGVEPAAHVQPEAEIVALPRSRTAAKAKAAFTLRLDPERHLKLRLACALSRRSAQQLVTEALDDFLDSLPELEALAQRMPGQAGQR